MSIDSFVLRPRGYYVTEFSTNYKVKDGRVYGQDLQGGNRSGNMVTVGK